ncbi:MAG: type II toxin-antitoxin system RelE/ParE family toxin [Candidatus Omnitrophica bacterium]|nr:type II toxin-antitoxin system RelE/ParE family toxin [Candidatus Omnitrophota bacterium]
MKIVWSPTALKRAAKISDYIAVDNVSEAKKWLNLLFSSVKRLKKYPQSGRITPEINNENIREIVLGNYRVIYEISKGAIHILTVRNYKQLIDFDELNKNG